MSTSYESGAPWSYLNIKADRQDGEADRANQGNHDRQLKAEDCEDERRRRAERSARSQRRASSRRKTGAAASAPWRARVAARHPRSRAAADASPIARAGPCGFRRMPRRPTAPTIALVTADRAMSLRSGWAGANRHRRRSSPRPMSPPASNDSCSAEVTMASPGAEVQSRGSEVEGRPLPCGEATAGGPRRPRSSTSTAARGACRRGRCRCRLRREGSARRR